MMIVIGAICWRICLYIWSYIVAQRFAFTPQFPYSDSFLLPSQLPRWMWSFANFDGVHYLNIVQHGYMAQFTQAFFPLYPLTVKFFGRVLLLRNDFASLIIIGQFVSFISLLATLVVFHKLVELDFNKNIAIKALWFLLIFPTSFYFGALYTESFFLCLVILSFWFARQKKWWLSSLCASLASATKITGVMLLFPLLWEYVRDSSTTNIVHNHKKFILHEILRCVKKILRSPIIYVVPIGLIVYMLYLQLSFHDPLYFWHAQSAFGAQRSSDTLIFPLQTLYRYLKILTSVSYTQQGFWVALYEFAITTFVIGLIALGHRLKLRSAYLLFSWLSLLIPLMTGTLSSMPRYVLIAFPIYLVLANIRNKLVFSVISVIFLLFQLLFSAQYLQGLWVA